MDMWGVMKLVNSVFPRAHIGTLFYDSEKKHVGFMPAPDGNRIAVGQLAAVKAALRAENVYVTTFSESMGGPEVLGIVAEKVGIPLEGRKYSDH